MHLIAKVMRISHANFHCNRLTTVQDEYSRLCESHFFWDTANLSAQHNAERLKCAAANSSPSCFIYFESDYTKYTQKQVRKV